MKRKRLGLVIIFVCLAAVALFMVLATPNAMAVVEFLDNENSGDANWIEPPVSLQEVHVWKRTSSVNQDWWKFNASAGQHVEVRFRKYTQYSNPQPPFEGATYMMKYEVLDLALRPIHEYHRTWSGGGGAAYRRDSWTYVVPENLDGKHYIRVWVDPGTNEYREHAYYWLNVTVTTPMSLNAQPSQNGVLEMDDNYNADYNHADMFVLDLVAGPVNSDKVTIHVHKDQAGADIRFEAWEYIPFGSASQRLHVVNRSMSGDLTDIEITFVATYTGMYHVLMYRSFYDEGSTPYQLSMSMAGSGHDGDNLAPEGMEITKAQTLKRVPIEMGLDNHDWYRVGLLNGDTKFRVTVEIDDPNVGDGHAYELVIYNETGFVLWAESSRTGGPSFKTKLEQPPPGTITIFDKDETYYVRFSADPVRCERGFAGFRAQYEITFLLSNRAPVLVVPFDQSYEWDEDESISIELDSHFMDPDDDDIEYTLQNRTQGFDYDGPALTFWGYLNITSPPDWSGEVCWRLRAVDKGQGPEHFIYVDLVLIVHEVPDLPISNGSIDISCDEEGMAYANLTTLFYDTDTGPGGVLTYGLNETGLTEVEVILDTETGTLQFVPAQDVFGTFTFDFFCTDDTGIPVGGTVELTVNAINDIPQIRGPIDIVRLDEGDDPIEIDLEGYFFDVDGDALKYTFSVPSEFSGDLNVFHKNNVVTESVIVIELTNDYFYATVVINVTCKDPDDTNVKQDLVIIVSNVPNQPSIEYSPVGNPSDIDEGDRVTFTVTDVLDPDVPEYGLHTYTWYLDDELLEGFNESSYTFSSTFSDSGTHNLRVIVTDPAGLTALQEPSWNFYIRDVNRLPTINITTLPVTINEDDKITLTAEYNDDDGDEITVSWYLIGKEQDKLLGTGTSIDSKLPPGTQTIEVEVDDGRGGKDTDSIIITVRETEEQGGMGSMIWIVLIIVVVAIVAVALLAMRGKSKGAVPEAKIDIESLQREYDPSQGRENGGEGGYDPTPKDWEEYEGLK
jgi:hypothetical protein